MGTRDAAMDKSIDPKVAEALMYAWRARDVLGLPQETVDLIADRVTRCARGPVLPLPERAPEPDQLELRAVRAPRHGHGRQRAAASTTTGRQLARFVRRDHGSRGPGRLAEPRPGYRFHYLPHRPPTHPFNLDSAEYASETVHFILYYEQALRAGMAPLAPEHVGCCGPGSSTSSTATGPTAAI